MTTRKWPALFTRSAVRFALHSERRALKPCFFLFPFLLVSALTAAPSAVAVGLGEISVNSSLNEPLTADIQILNSTALEDGQILVSLASAEAFERAGISRDFFLSQLQFSVSRDGVGQRVIRVVTQEPVVEPYLDFLVQLQWPEGRVMREYTVLLDLPIYSDEQYSVPVVPAISASSTSAPASNANGANTFSSNRSSVATEPVSGDQHQVVEGDTLWNVATRLRPQGTTILQAMDSLYQQNPRAFVDGDANRLMKGFVLRLPSPAEISQQNGERVAQQIGLLPASDELFFNPEETVSEPEVIYSDDYAETELPGRGDGRLDLVAGVDSESDSGSVSSADSGMADEASAPNEGIRIQELSADLAVAQDEVSKMERENAELRDRLVLLEAQVATMAELVNQSAATAKVKASEPEQGVVGALLAVPGYIWGGLIAVHGLLLVLLLRQSSTRSKSDDLDSLPVRGYETYDNEDAVAATSAGRLHDLDDLELDPDDDLFDESDRDIFEDLDEPMSEEVFDMMVEAVAEAEVYLSLGNIAQAIEVLEEARAEDAADASSRLKLMEILFREGQKDQLSALYEEILITGDSAAIEMAGIIAGPQEEAVKALDDAANEHDSPEPEDSPELAERFGLEDSLEPTESLEPTKSLEPDETDTLDDDLDLETLDLDDFDIELDEEEQEHQHSGEGDIIELPGSDDLNESLAELAAESALEADEFAGVDDVETLDGTDIKLDLAKTYIEMGDPQGAREILEELIGEADEGGIAKAQALLDTLE